MEQTAADVLRVELKSLLADLDAEIRVTFPASSAELTCRTHVAELSVVRELAGLAREALLGDRLPQEPRCISSGQAMDMRDALAVVARDVCIERERQEKELALLQERPWPADLRAAFQRLIDEEQRVCEHLAQTCAAAREHASALRVVVSNVADACLDALSRATHAAPQERLRLADLANADVEAAAAAWLRWSHAQMVNSAKHWQACRPIDLPRLLTEASAGDSAVAAFLSTVRKAMKLRRQQIRLVAVQQRLAAVLAACDVLASLQRSIQLA